MEALFKNREKFNHLVQVTEVRMVKADNIPMSPAKGQKDHIGIHFTWWRKHDEIVKVLPYVEKILTPFNVKPHYGKIFELSGKKFNELFSGKDLNLLRAMILHLDPKGKFRNDFIDKYIFDNLKITDSVAKDFISKNMPLAKM